VNPIRAEDQLVYPTTKTANAICMVAHHQTVMAREDALAKKMLLAATAISAGLDLLT
jgi:hypothetical protein